MLAINTRIIINRDKFTGCDAPKLFVDSNEFRIIKIDFQKACDDLQICADDLNKRRETCLEEFEKLMKEECDKYTNFNGIRRRYCKAIQIENLEVAEGLPKTVFTNYEIAFKAVIYEGAAAASCLGGNSLQIATASCAGEVLTFIRLYDNLTNDVQFDDGEFYVIRNAEGDCLSGATFVECDFNDEDQRWEIEPNQTTPGQVSITNNGQYLLLDATAGNPIAVGAYATTAADLLLSLVPFNENEIN